MCELKKLAFRCSEERYRYAEQYDALKRLIEPVLRRRYQAKMESLGIEEHYLSGCKVSLPYLFKPCENPSKDWNTRVAFVFPQSHPLLKGKLEVLYTRASLKDYFNSPSVEGINLNTFKDMDKEQYTVWWWNFFERKLGQYFTKFGRLTTCQLSEAYDTEGKSLIVQIPRLEQVRATFRCYEHIDHMQITFPFECRLYSVGDYVIYNDDLILPFTITKERKDDTDSAIPVLP